MLSPAELNRLSNVSRLRLLICLGRIIFKEFRHCLLQILIVLIGVFLEVDGLAGIPTPDQLLFCGVIHVNHQRPNGRQ